MLGVRRQLRFILLGLNGLHLASVSSYDRSLSDLKFPRYKIVVQVVLGQVRQQGVKVASRCLWDADADNHASYTFENVRDALAAVVLLLSSRVLPLTPGPRRTLFGARRWSLEYTPSSCGGRAVQGQAGFLPVIRRVLVLDARGIAQKWLQR